MAQQTQSIKGPVGRGGRNNREDTRTVQALLNDHVRPPIALLAEDGLVGPKTVAAITGFQKKKFGKADGRVDPGHRTIKALNGAASAGPAKPVAKTPAGVDPKDKQQMHQVFVDNKINEKEWAAFWNFLVKDGAPEVKRFFSYIKKAEEARMVAEFYVTVRKSGIQPGDFRQIFQAISGVGKPKWGTETVKWLSAPTGGAGRLLKRLNDMGKAAGFVVFLIEYIDHWNKGDYHMAFVEIYKQGMGDAVPVGGFLDGLQSFAGFVVPKSWKSETAFKWFKTIDPVGLGGVAVDTLGVFIHSGIDLVSQGKMDERRMGRLVDRMKKGPTQVFAEIGEDCGDALYQISQMSDSEFDEFMSIGMFGSWIKSWFT